MHEAPEMLTVPGEKLKAWEGPRGEEPVGQDQKRTTLSTGLWL